MLSRIAGNPPVRGAGTGGSVMCCAEGGTGAVYQKRRREQEDASGSVRKNSPGSCKKTGEDIRETHEFSGILRFLNEVNNFWMYVYCKMMKIWGEHPEWEKPQIPCCKKRNKLYT
jgi:hypothetical protein